MDFLVDFLLDFYGPYPYLIIFGILLGCGLGIPIPEDITLIAAGALTYYGVSDLGLMIVVSMFGVMIGDSFMYFLGAHYGRKLTKKWFFQKILPDERLEKVSKMLNERGPSLLFAARFMPGLRAPIFFSSGVLHVPYWRFFAYDGSAALISVPAIIVSVFYLGETIEKWIRKIEHGILALIVAVILFFVIKHFVKTAKEKKAASS
ncbi:MAG: DedA family protein [Bdellovibrionales bacterium]|nr:DedA family protein [Bdellovibrionales bacterium]